MVAADDAIRHAVLGISRRDLPWRRTRDPWAVLVSEVMLQQTQVSRVVPAYRRFLDRFPTVAACAEAPVAEVIRRWAGLGYNRRATNLHRAARAMGDRVPDTYDELVALPGIGPYTARAVLAFAHERDVAVVDTNVARLLARWRGRPLRPAEVQAEADRLLPAGRSWAWNQALLDLGALVCTKRAPLCADCPVSAHCAWRGAGDDPARVARQPAFAGSDRQGRGRLVEALRTGPVPLSTVAAVAGWPDDEARAHRVVDGLVADGLAVRGDDALRLPEA